MSNQDKNPFIEELTLNVITQEFTNDSVKAVRLADRIYEWFKTKNDAFLFSEWILDKLCFNYLTYDEDERIWIFWDSSPIGRRLNTEELYKEFLKTKQ